MINLGLEIVFWFILLSYLGVKLVQSKKGFKHQH